MLPLTVETDYLSVDTDAWLDDLSEVDDELTADLVAYLEALGDMYVQPENVLAWLTAVAQRCDLTDQDDIERWLADEYTPPSGIYGEDGPTSVATCNEDTFLTNEISFTFAHAGDLTLIVETGREQFAHSPAYAVVRQFNGDDDSDAFRYASGWLSHTTPGYAEKCGTEWILEDTVRMWRNGGRGYMPRIDDCILPNEEGELHIVCPDCGDVLAAFCG